MEEALFIEIIGMGFYSWSSFKVTDPMIIRIKNLKNVQKVTKHFQNFLVHKP